MRSKGRSSGESPPFPSSLLEALLVYVEPLAAGVHAVVVGDAESPVAERLLELGARGVLVFDPDPARAAHAAQSAPRGVTVRALVDELDVRDGAFDLAVVPDLAELNDPRATVGRLKRAVAKNGAVVAMGRASLDPGDTETQETAIVGTVTPPFAAELGPAALDYAELYELFAGQFDEVTLAGVLPFRGVVFAELGSSDESPAVSVDTRLANAEAPSIFVVVASQSVSGEPTALDPYAIVQVPPDEQAPRETTLVLEATLAEAQLKAELLASQLEEARDRLVVADVRSVEAAARLDRASAERDVALTRAMELEAVLAASQQTMGTLERRLLEAEQGMLERDDRIAVLSAENDAQRARWERGDPAPSWGNRVEAPLGVTLEEVAAIVARAELAEQALAQALAALAQQERTRVAPDVIARLEREIEATRAEAERFEAERARELNDLAQVTEAHAAETAAYEERLRERAGVVAELEKELVRREQLVKELIASLGTPDPGDDAPRAPMYEAAVPLRMSAPRVRAETEAELQTARQEVAELREKLDELAGEIARREGELVARGWRIQELENERKRWTAVSPADAPEVRAPVEEPRVRDEVDALRQALTQEHAARIAAESGEELVRARSELARQAALLEQMRGRLTP